MFATKEQIEQFRKFFIPRTRLSVKRPGKKAYSGIIREFAVWRADTIVVIQMPRKTKWVNVMLGGVYTIGERTLRVKPGGG